jgi:hypothetical protein
MVTMKNLNPSFSRKLFCSYSLIDNEFPQKTDLGIRLEIKERSFVLDETDRNPKR